MATDLQEADIIGRLRTLTAVDVPNATLALASYIPAGNAWMDTHLSNNGSSYDNLTASKKALAKAAAIAHVCLKIVAAAPLNESQAGPIRVIPIKAAEQKVILKELKAEIKEVFALMGIKKQISNFASSGGDDYHPDDEDLTQIDFADEAEDFSLWG